MMTVKEVSKRTGVSVRTLQYYDKIGLLKPTSHTSSGYRLYDDTALELLQQVLLFRELEFPLKEIKQILSRPDFDSSKALEQQITLLTLKKEHLENLIDFARGIKLIGIRRVSAMDFSVFDTKKIDEYVKQAREQWGQTEAYKEFEQKAKGRSKEEDRAVTEGLMQLFVEFGELKEADAGPESAQAQSQVSRLQEYLTEYFYQCSNDMLLSLGEMYAGGGEFTANIDAASGKGAAEFAAEAIRIYCRK